MGTRMDARFLYIIGLIEDMMGELLSFSKFT